MVRIYDGSLKEMLKDDVEHDRLKGLAKEFVCSYLATDNPDGKFIGGLIELLSKAKTSEETKWTKQFIEMIGRLQSYESLLYSMHGYRDHIAHSVRVCLLGYYLMIRPPMERFFRVASEESQTKWLLASLFHDICVPLSRMRQVQTRVETMMSSYPGINFSGHAHLEVGFAAFAKIKRIMQQADSGFCVDLIGNAVKGNHGALGAIVLLQTFDGYLDDAILRDIACAVCVHDDACHRLDFSQNPLAGLLIISDELQEWDRPYVDRSAVEKVLRLDFVDVDLTNSLIEVGLNYRTPTSFTGYIPIEIDETVNSQKKKENLARLSLPFRLSIAIKDRKGKSATIDIG